MTQPEIESECNRSLDAAYREYPAGCDESQMKTFLLKNCKYPKIAFAILNGHPYQHLIDNEVKYGKEN